MVGWEGLPPAWVPGVHGAAGPGPDPRCCLICTCQTQHRPSVTHSGNLGKRSWEMGSIALIAREMQLSASPP